MIKRVDVFMPISSQYGALHHFTQGLYHALMRCGAVGRLLTWDSNNPMVFFNQLLDDPPDFTVAFNGVLPDKEGHFLCDLVKIPHIACLVDSPRHFLPLIKSQYTTITCIDHFFCQTFKRLQFPKVHFMPLAIEKDVLYDPQRERPYDVTLLASHIDHEKIAIEWENNYETSVCHALMNEAEKCLKDTSRDYSIELVQALNADVRDMNALITSFELYIRGFERMRLVKAIKNLPVHIFGSGHTQEYWDRHLGKGHSVIIHPAVPFDESLELMKASKIVLNSCAWIRNGAHDRIFSGLACGAAVVTSVNPYLQRDFTGGESIFYYGDKDWSDLEEMILEIINDEQKRSAMAEKGRGITMRSHTWDERAAFLLKTQL